jgi:hypothetical protein
MLVAGFARLGPGSKQPEPGFEPNSADAQNNQEMLGPIAGYRAQRDQQPALATVISSSQARQIFEAQVGNMQLTDIPLISIAAYALWAYVGPPWANIPCWPTTFGCIDNPLYNTITAQLVRGLEGTGGAVSPGSQQAQNMLKNQAQQEEAITAIQDSGNQEGGPADPTGGIRAGLWGQLLPCPPGPGGPWRLLSAHAQRPP